MNIPNGLGAHIIGKKGKTIMEIKNTHNVQISTKVDTDKNTTLTLQGTKTNIDNTIANINIRIQDQLDKQIKDKEISVPYSEETCKYYQEGSCRYGTKCWRKHPSNIHTEPMTVKVNRETPYTAQRERRPEREASRDRPRHERHSDNTQRNEDRLRTSEREARVIPSRSRRDNHQREKSERDLKMWERYDQEDERQYRRKRDMSHDT